MPHYLFVWTPSIEDYLDQHGVTPEEFERVVQNPDSRGRSRSTGRVLAYGEADDGRVILCVYQMIDACTVEPATAYFLED